MLSRSTIREFIMISWIYLLIFCCTAMGKREEKDDEVKVMDANYERYVGNGFLVGQIWEVDKKPYQIYKGIPYAEPPVGDLRFRPSVMKQPWTGNQEATQYGPACIQFADFYLNDRYQKQNPQPPSEDCLYLNIFAPANEDKRVLHPVMVWVHGGSFLAGSGETSINIVSTARNLVSKGVIVVTLNYRLGAAGFLSYTLPNGTFRGNWGLWDIKTALEWINLNIRNLGGDKESVTLFGESAGAAAISLLALSPETKGLMSRAIIMSGSAAAGWAISRSEVPRWEATNVVSYLNCEKEFSKEDQADMIRSNPEIKGPCNFLRTPFTCDSDAETSEEWMDCLRTGFNLTDKPFLTGLARTLMVAEPVVDGWLIPAPVEDMLRNASLIRIPIMIGNAEDEWGNKQGKAPLLHSISLKRMSKSRMTQFLSVMYDLEAAQVMNKHLSGYYYDFKEYKELEESEIRSLVRRLTLEKFESLYGSKFLEGSEDGPKKHRHAESTLDVVSNASYYRYITSRGRSKPWNTKNILKPIHELEADIEFHAPTVKEADAYAHHNKTVYVYSFEHLPTAPIYEEEAKSYNFFGSSQKVEVTRRGNFKEAFHGLDHAFLFGNGYALLHSFETDKKDRQLARAISTLFTNFARTGNPTEEPYKGFQWDPYTSQEPSYARIKNPLELAPGKPKQAAVSFWNQMIPYLKDFAYVNDPTATRNIPLSDEERIQLEAYRRAWWALWVLVAVIAILLWVVVICLVARKCMSPRTKKFNHVIVSNNR